MQTFTGKEYLKIDIASSFGLDKQNWDDRIAWFDKNEAQLLSLTPQADDPALFYAGLCAWSDTKAGKPTGYMISLDATASGLQILAALTGDRKAAQHCNVVDVGSRQDAYSNLYKIMLQRTGGKANISHSDTKDAIMTSFYGSKAIPKKVFGEGDLLQTFFSVMNTEAPAAWELNETLLSMWDPNATSYNWILPDNFHVHSKVMDTVVNNVVIEGETFEVTEKVNTSTDSGRSIGANLVHSIDGMIVRELTRRCDFDPQKLASVKKMAELALMGACDNRASTEDDDAVITLWELYKQSGYLSVRIFDHLTGDNFGHVDPTYISKILSSFPKRPFKVISVHDCFRVLPNYGNELREQYNLQLALIASSNLLEFTLSQITQRQIQITKLDPTLHLDVLNTNYALS